MPNTRRCHSFLRCTVLLAGALLGTIGARAMEPVLSASGCGTQLVQIPFGGSPVVIAGRGGDAPAGTEYRDPVPPLEEALGTVVSPVASADGTIHFGDRFLVRRIDPARKQMVVAAKAEGPVSAVAVSPLGPVVFSAQSRAGVWQVHQIEPDGKLTLLAGDGHGRALAYVPQALGSVSSLAFTPEGDLLIAERGPLMKPGGGRIRKLALQTSRSLLLKVIAGGGFATPSSTPRPAILADLDAPGCLTLAKDDSLWFAHQVKRVPAGKGLLGAFKRQICRVDPAGAITARPGGEGTPGDELKEADCLPVILKYLSMDPKDLVAPAVEAKAAPQPAVPAQTEDPAGTGTAA